MIYAAAFFAGWYGAWYALTWYPGFGLAAILFVGSVILLWNERTGRHL